MVELKPQAAAHARIQQKGTQAVSENQLKYTECTIKGTVHLSVICEVCAAHLLYQHSFYHMDVYVYMCA